MMTITNNSLDALELPDNFPSYDADVQVQVIYLIFRFTVDPPHGRTTPGRSAPFTG